MLNLLCDFIGVVMHYCYGSCQSQKWCFSKWFSVDLLSTTGSDVIVLEELSIVPSNERVSVLSSSQTSVCSSIQKKSTEEKSEMVVKEEESNMKPVPIVTSSSLNQTVVKGVDSPQVGQVPSVIRNQSTEHSQPVTSCKEQVPVEVEEAQAEEPQGLCGISQPFAETSQCNPSCYSPNFYYGVPQMMYFGTPQPSQEPQVPLEESLQSSQEPQVPFEESFQSSQEPQVPLEESFQPQEMPQQMMYAMPQQSQEDSQPSQEVPQQPQEDSQPSQEVPQQMFYGLPLQSQVIPQQMYYGLPQNQDVPQQPQEDSQQSQEVPQQMFYGLPLQSQVIPQQMFYGLPQNQDVPQQSQEVPQQAFCAFSQPSQFSQVSQGSQPLYYVPTQQTNNNSEENPQTDMNMSLVDSDMPIDNQSECVQGPFTNPLAASNLPYMCVMTPNGPMCIMSVMYPFSNQVVSVQENSFSDN